MKRIEDLDPNFKLVETIPAHYVFLDPREAPFSLWGLCPNAEGSYCRLPLELLPQCSEGVQELAWHLAGACVRFTTDADGLAVVWALRGRGNMPHFAATGQSGMELFEETDGGTRQIKTIIPQMEDGCGCRTNQSFYAPLPGGLRHYALYLPLYNGLKEFLLGFPPEAKIEAGRTPRFEKPLVFYGSSITQGGCASKVGSMYSTVLCRRLDAAQINLGFSGNAKGEETMARYIASLPMSAFIMDYDHNAPNLQHLAGTHERFFRIIRDAQPELPIVMASLPDFDRDPAGNGARRNVVVKAYERALEAGDRNVYFVDGQSFFGNTDRDMCTVDGCHPNDLGFLRMADRFEPVLRQILHI
ncbi:MAG: hypothetical protein J5602_06325 [Clostridia bacterium]|nr:hypothetical protein [Clostridia bacterium]